MFPTAHPDIMVQRGWHFDRQDSPPSMHLMASPRHKLVVDDFLAGRAFPLEAFSPEYS